MLKCQHLDLCLRELGKICNKCRRIVIRIDYPPLFFQVYDALVKKGMIDNTVIIFTTDNGGPANGFDYNWANNFPLRGVKATLWEGQFLHLINNHQDILSHAVPNVDLLL